MGKSKKTFDVTSYVASSNTKKEKSIAVNILETEKVECFSLMAGISLENDSTY